MRRTNLSAELKTPVFETLEARRMLSGVPQAVLESGARPLEWKGRTIHAKPGQWVLQLNGLEGGSEGQLAEANKRLGRLNGAIRATRHLGSDGLLLIEAPENLLARQLERTLQQLGSFAYVEPNAAVWSTELSNDPSFGQLWGMNNTGQAGGTADADIDAPEAWDVLTGGADVVVGIVDSGIDYKHPDLQSNAWVNTSELNGRRNVDDDGNGYKDDIYGYDFYNLDSDPMDDSGHGTHVAGTIAAKGNNGIGVAGVSWNAKVMALKFLNASGSGWLAGAAEAINYATKMNTQYNVNIRVTNNSWGGFDYSQALDDAIRANAAAGMLFVAAAGNDGGAPLYPSIFQHDNIISVAATDRNDALAPFSNFGSGDVDIAAPGVEIYSTLPRGTYGSKNGTSMAAPHVTGVAALAWSYRPSATAAQVRAALLTGVDSVESLTGKVSTGGRLNAFNALQRLDATYAAPAAPVGLTATATHTTRIELTWQASTDPDVEGYNIYRSVNGGQFLRIASASADSTSFANRFLIPGTEYAYRITARNFLSEESAPSEVATARTLGDTVSIPLAPSNLAATTASRTQINLSWTDNSTNETAFSVERSINGTTWSEIAWKESNITMHNDINLKRGTRYYYRVRAYNQAGYSPYSEVKSAVPSSASGMLPAGSNNIFSNTRIAPGSEPDAEETDLMDLVA